ncbi:MAG: hypothetical protein ACOYXT_18565 [Bacteroidota bacterium]
MKIAIAAIHLVILFFIAFAVWRKETTLKTIFWPAYLVKLLAGLALGFVYSYYYTVGDTFNYFDDGKLLAQLAQTDAAAYFKFLWLDVGPQSFWEQLKLGDPRALFLTKITSLFNLATFNNYWIISLYFSSLSFFSAWLLVKALTRFYPHATTAAAFAFLFFPTVVFWSAGLIKESVAIASLLFLTTVFLKIWFEKKIGMSEAMVALVSVWCLWKLKYYYAAIFIPVAFTTLVVKYVFMPMIKSKGAWYEITLWLIVFMVPLFVVSFLHPNFYPENILEVMVSNHDVFHQVSAAEDVIHFSDLEPSAGSVLRNSPLALISGLFRPWLGEAEGLFQWIVAIENFILLILSLFAMRHMGSALASPNRLLTIATAVYVVLLCIFITLSTPNFGTLCRYRTGYLPFFVLLICGKNPLVEHARNFLQRSLKRLVP